MRSAGAEPGGASALRVVPEVRLTVAGARTALLLLPIAALTGLAVGGARSAAGATAGVAIVATLGLACLPLYRWGDARGASAVLRIAAVGIGLRLGLALVLLAVATRFSGLSVTGLGAGVAAGLFATHVTEMIVAARDPRLSFVNPHPETRTAA